MKNRILIACSVLLSISLFAQRNEFHFSNGHPFIQDEKGEFIWFYPLENVHSVENQKILDKRMADKLKNIQKTAYNKEGEKKFTTTHSFNQLGRITGIEFFNHKKQTKSVTQINYFNDSLINEVKIITPKKDTTIYKYFYEEINGKLYFKGSERKENTKIENSVLIIRNKAGKTTSNLQRFGHKLKHSSETKSYYSEDNQLVKTEYYYNKKLKSVYNYDCNAEGKKVEDKKVKSSDICKWTEERSDGSYIMYSRTTEEKNNYLNASLFDKDSTFIYWKQYLNDSILVQSRNYYNETKTEVYRRFNDKQKLKSSYKYIYDESRNVLEHEYIHYRRKHTYVQTNINTYNSDNLLETNTRYGNHKKPYTTTYSYNSKGLIVKAIQKHGVKKPTVSNLTYEYTFFE